jgi:hypothetical protein
VGESAAHESSIKREVNAGGANGVTDEGVFDDEEELINYFSPDERE